jgi:hypothetical protein
MAKRHGRPSVQYRYEHYDPRASMIVYPTDRNQFAVNIGDVPVEVAVPATADSQAAATPDE